MRRSVLQSDVEGRYKHRMSYLESAILGKEIIVRFSNKTNEFCLKFKLKGGNERRSGELFQSDVGSGRTGLDGC